MPAEFVAVKNQDDVDSTVLIVEGDNEKVFLSIANVKENFHERTLSHPDGGIGVHVDDLIHALIAIGALSLKAPTATY